MHEFWADLKKYTSEVFVVEFRKLIEDGHVSLELRRYSDVEIEYSQEHWWSHNHYGYESFLEQAIVDSNKAALLELKPEGVEFSGGPVPSGGYDLATLYNVSGEESALDYLVELGEALGDLESYCMLDESAAGELEYEYWSEYFEGELEHCLFNALEYYFADFADVMLERHEKAIKDALWLKARQMSDQHSLDEITDIREMIEEMLRAEGNEYNPLEWRYAAEVYFPSEALAEQIECEETGETYFMARDGSGCTLHSKGGRYVCITSAGGGHEWA